MISTTAGSSCRLVRLGEGREADGKGEDASSHMIGSCRLSTFRGPPGKRQHVFVRENPVERFRREVLDLLCRKDLDFRGMDRRNAHPCDGVATDRPKGSSLPSLPSTLSTSTSGWSALAHAARQLGAAQRPGSGPPRATAGRRRRPGPARTRASSRSRRPRSRRVPCPGSLRVPRPKSSRSLPAAITGTTPASATLCMASFIASFADRSAARRRRS